MSDTPCRTWQIADFADSGQFCSVQTVSDLVGTLRDELDVDGCVVLPVRDRTLFAAVAAYATAGRSRRSGVLADLLARALTASEKGTMAEAIAAQLADADSDRIPEELLEVLHPLLEESGFGREAMSRIGSSPAVAADRSSLRVFFVTWSARGGSAAVASLPTADDLESLRALVACTAPVYAHATANAYRRSMLRAKRTSCSLPTSGKDLSTADLLTRAMSATGSQNGAIYLAAEGPAGVETRSARIRASLDLVVVHGTKAPEQLASSDDSTVSRAYRRVRATMFDRGLEYISENPAPVLGANAFEFAVPIARFPDGDGQALGALVVARQTDELGCYSAHDLRELTLWGHRIAASNVDETLRQTTSLFTSLSQPVRLETEDQASADEILAAPDTPADFLSARRDLQDIVDTITRTTSSHTASVRVLSYAGTHSVRIGMSPIGNLGDSHNLIAVSEARSVISWVLRNGAKCYLPNVDDPSIGNAFPGLKGYLSVLNDAGRRRQTRSALCAPVYVDGSVVGAINCESPWLGAYDDNAHIIEALAGLAGLHLVSVRRAREQQVVRLGTRLYGFSHSLKNVADELRRTAKEKKDGRLDEIAQLIEHCVSAGRRNRRRHVQDSKVHELVARVLADFKRSRKLAEIELRTGSGVDETESNLDPVVADGLEYAMGELLRNAYDATPLVTARRRIFVSVGVLPRFRSNSLEHPLVEIANEVADSGKGPEPNQLFRVPVRLGEGDDAPLHLGCFLAGMVMRSVGGEALLRPGDDWFRAQLVLPPASG